MASPNTLLWIQKNRRKITGKTLEIGAKFYSEHSTLDLRRYVAENCKKVDYIGCDIEAGSNVDVVLDFTKPFAEIDGRLEGERYNTVFCISVLEHIPDVFSAARNISSVMAPGGALFVSVPFVFRFHGYPSDYWRFTPEAIKHLFPDFEFSDDKGALITTMTEGEKLTLDSVGVKKINRFLFRPKDAAFIEKRKEAKRDGEDVDEYALAPCMINMVGIKRLDGEP